MPAVSDFVHLHLHTEYSLLDGASRASEVAQRAAEWGMPAVGLTDHGNLFGVVPFYQACREQGVKPILGVEAYMIADGGSRLERTRGGRDGGKSLCHLTLLAENETGYRNLLKLVSDSWLNGFYYKPRMDWELLSQHHDGLICMSACLGGELAQSILNDAPERARATALRYRELFGPEHYFLELMEHHTEDDARVNRALVELGRETGIPLVATNDVHYLDESDADPQDLLLCIQTGCLHSDPKRMRMSSRELFFRSAAQMTELFADLPPAITNTRAIAERCCVELKFGDLVLPDFPVPEGHTPGSYLRELSLERVGRFYDPVTPEIRERLDYELRVIDDKGYAAYLLIVWDLIDFAKRRGIRVGPGRGSAAGSLVAYVLGITELCPLRYELYFERFLNPDRPSAPDIDIDFPPERREEVVAYTIEKYGPNRTAKIITFGTMGARAAIKDVGRVMEVPIPAVNDLTGLVPERVGITLDAALEEVEELRRRYESDARTHDLIEAARRLEGMARHTSIHAAALVIARDELTRYVPLCRVSGGEDVVTQFDMDAVDQIGLLKMDFLGLRTMTVIDEACRMIRERGDEPEFDVRSVPLDDAKTFELVGRGDVVGLFQLESGGFQRVCRDLKPDCIDDLVALVALYRPGPMERIPEFIARKHGQSAVVFAHPLLEPILRSTYGIIVYQEQVMAIGRALGGFTMAEGDSIRKAVGKKDQATMAKVREQFIAGCATQSIPAAVAQEVMDQIEDFSRYGFNKAHSACYGLIAYWTAYLKANYPREFMAAQLTSVMGNRDKLVGLINDTRGMGIAVRPPCVNTGGVTFEVHADQIVYGLAAINGVGANVAEAIVRERKADGPFGDLYDLCRRTDSKVLPKATLEKLLAAGAGSSFGPRRALLEGYEAIFESAAKAQADAAAGQGTLFDLDDESTSDLLVPKLPPTGEYPADRLRQLDTDYLGLVLFEDPLDAVHKALAGCELELTRANTLAELPPETPVVLGGMLDECVPFVTRKGNTMARGRLLDVSGPASLVLFPQVYESAGELARQGRVVIVIGKTEAADARRGGASVLVDRLLPPDEWKRAKRNAASAKKAQAAAPPPPLREAPANGATNGRPAPEPEVQLLDVRLQVGDGLTARLADVAGALRRHLGTTPVMLWLDHEVDFRRLHLGGEFRAAWSPALEAELQAIDGCTVTAR